jgi:hypothetical protein
LKGEKQKREFSGVFVFCFLRPYIRNGLSLYQ